MQKVTEQQQTSKMAGRGWGSLKEGSKGLDDVMVHSLVARVCNTLEFMSVYYVCIYPIINNILLLTISFAY